MTQLNKGGESKAMSLINAGLYDTGSAWSMSAEDENKLLGADGKDWSTYAKWHLGEDTAAAEDTKARWKYPFGKSGKVYRHALTAIRSRASQQGDTAIYEAAGRLIADMDKKEGKQGAEDAGESRAAEDATPRMPRRFGAKKLAREIAKRLDRDPARIHVRFASAAMEPKTCDDKARTVDMVVSAGSPVLRHDWKAQRDYHEVLDISPKAIRMDRFNNGAPLLDSHWGRTLDGVLGAVVPGSARIEGGQLRAKVKFSASPYADQVYRDVKAGIIRNASVGYETHAEEIDETKDPPVYRATDWEPYEVSAVAMGADPHAGFRSISTRAAPPATEEESTVTGSTPAGTPAVDEKSVRANAIKDERDRISKIEAFGKRFGLDEAFVAKHRAEGTSYEAFCDAVVEEKAIGSDRAGNPSGTPAAGQEPGVLRSYPQPRRSYHLYSRSRRLSQMTGAWNLSQDEAEQLLDELDRAPDLGMTAAAACRAMAGAARDHMPVLTFIEKEWGDAALARALAAGTGASGGFIIPEIYATEIIELLRPITVVRSLNPVLIPMSGGNINLPRLNAGALISYVGENMINNATQETFGNVKATEKKLLGLVPISNDLIKFSTPQADAVVRDDIVAQLKVAEDVAFIRGLGTQFSPKGLRNWAATTAASAGSTNANVTTDLFGADTALKQANVRMLRPGWIFSPRSINSIRALQSTTGNFIYRDEIDQKKTLLGYPFRQTSSVPINLSGTQSEIYLADFADVAICDVPGLEIEVSREAAYNDSGGNLVAAFTQDQTVIRIIARHDLIMRHDPSAYVVTGVLY